ncbi:DsbA family oxidoreductase [Colwellia echini]|uniref:Disulfide bond formation protein DsbA n=1 Tax=Colwellia echini TaxID=1982103 RepID=A0ABY3MVE8_9GAMM|nr:DsbA family protein [Colwellia echini]TYK65183.1 disulfide bond formation protein DsbA [Colwellia echini]
MTQPIIIEYYSDVLCVWAWIAQRRIDELNKVLADKIEVRYRYLDVFGDASHKIPTQWQEKGGFSGFAKHVQHSAQEYPDAPVNSLLWETVRPKSSANPHLVLKGLALTQGEDAGIEMALIIRKAFFIDAKEISQLDVLFELIAQAGFDVDSVKAALNDGTAMAALMADYQQAKAQSLKGSPTYIIDNGRQVLYGNVGYRVLLANIEEQLKSPSNEASWC